MMSLTFQYRYCVWHDGVDIWESLNAACPLLSCGMEGYNTTVFKAVEKKAMCWTMVLENIRDDQYILQDLSLVTFSSLSDTITTKMWVCVTVSWQHIVSTRMQAHHGRNFCFFCSLFYHLLEKYQNKICTHWEIKDCIDVTPSNTGGKRQRAPMVTLFLLPASSLLCEEYTDHWAQRVAPWEIGRHLANFKLRPAIYGLSMIVLLFTFPFVVRLNICIIPFFNYLWCWTFAL